METIFFPLDDDDLGIEEHDLDSYCYVLVKQNDGIAEPPVVFTIHVHYGFENDYAPYAVHSKEAVRTCINLGSCYLEHYDTYIYGFGDVDFGAHDLVDEVED